jgi:membrane protease YdiL (CAAX protease family)
MTNNTKSASIVRISDLLWKNKLSLSIIITILLICIVILPNLGVLLAVVFVIIALLIGIKQGSFKSIGIIRQERWSDTLIKGMILGVVLQLAYSIIFDPLIEKLTGIPIDLSGFDSMRGNLPILLLWLLIGIGFGGFLEEITFRGYLITRLKIIMGDSPLSLIIILLLTSASFGLAHLYQDWSGVISTGSFAFIFGIIFIFSKYNLWMPILTHAFANVVGLLLIYTDYDRVLNGLLF